MPSPDPCTPNQYTFDQQVAAHCTRLGLHRYSCLRGIVKTAVRMNRMDNQYEIRTRSHRHVALEWKTLRTTTLRGQLVVSRLGVASKPSDDSTRI